PVWDRYFASGKEGNPPAGVLRFSGGGDYLGVLVVLIAFWAALQAFRKKSIFDLTRRKLLWFWIVVSVISLLLAFGRFAPFYRFIYVLPFFSSIRNPGKFIITLVISINVLFAYGIDGLARSWLETTTPGGIPVGTRFKNWWARAAAFDKRWVAGCFAAIILSLIGWIIYRISQPHLEAYLVEMARLEALAQNISFDSGAASYSAHMQAAFSVRQVGWFILFLVASVGMMVLIFTGVFSGRQATLGGILLGVILVGDLGRANLPWIVYFNYPQKYASNPVIDLLRQKPYEHRVAILPFNFPQQFYLFEQLYKIEWAQHQFQYYNVQSLDIVQMPRVPEDLLAFETALQFRGTPDTVHLLTRRWTLTNTRYLLGPAGFLDVLNQQLDPAKHRFRIVQSFNVVPKPGIENPTSLEELTAQPAANGAYALFEFTGALPRAKLYSNWEIPAKNPAVIAKLKSTALTTNDLESLKSVGTNDFLTLQMLASTNFNPHETVLVADSTPVPTEPAQTNLNSGSVQYESYAPKDIKLKTQSDAASVLLLNDKYDPHWNVRVDGKPTELLRCNFIMRGVYLPAGQHDVEFTFKTDTRLLYVSLAAIAVGLCLLAYVCVSGRKNDPS
ncbi:MAG TPA: hypothetical protein VFM25_07835, partial [Verrucomicrobiae bacterium]|nr:hypothetical protein [Verrucomicrobiae bacterium]